MGNRVAATEVKEIISTDLSDAVVDTFITAANLVVTDALGGQSLDAALLKEVERWLSAHFLACTRAQQAQAEGAEGANITYQGQTGKGLDATLYGQQVKVLDPTGLVEAAASSRREASIRAVTSFE